MSSRDYLIIILLIIIILSTEIVSSNPITVSPDHNAYFLIERLQAKGILKDFLSNTKPYTRGQIAKMIAYILALEEDSKVKLNETEKKQLDLLKQEFAQELIALGITNTTAYKHLINWSDDSNKLITEIGNKYYAGIGRGTDDSNISRNTLQVVIYGNLKRGLFFYNDSRASYEKSDEPRPIWDPYTTPGRYPWSAVSDSYLIFQLPWTNLQIGKDAIRWGPGYHGVIGLAGVDPTFDIIKLPIDIWKVKFTNIIGFLRDDLAKEYKSDITRKYLSAHRLEVQPLSGICIGWQEVYIYSEIHPELLNPIMPYQMAEDYLGEVGNNTMEGDVDLCIIPNTRIYLSLFLDDFHPNESLFSYGANRWSALAGIFIVDPFGINNTDLRFEYARVEPWTYPHKGITQIPPVPLSYKHFDTPLGHWIGPNADNMFFETNYQFSKSLRATLSYERIRKGEIGGSLYDYDSKAMSSKKRFLAGITEKTHSINTSLEYRFFQNSAIEIEYIYTTIENKQKEEAKLPGWHTKKEPWKAGKNWSQNAINLTFMIRY